MTNKIRLTLGPKPLQVPVNLWLSDQPLMQQNTYTNLARNECIMDAAAGRDR